MNHFPVEGGRVLVALLIGLLIGLDRERAEVRKRRPLFAGVRTFPLIALAGCLPMLFGGTAGLILVAIGFLGVAAIAAVSYARSSAAGELGATTEIAALGTYLLGALSGHGQPFVAAAAGIAVAVLLVAKPQLERFSRALSREEIAAALELAVISVIVLPLLPNRGYGPWEVLNPREIWLIVVLVTGLSFGGFIAMRLFGESRGLILAGAIGGLISSTAVTWSMSQRSRAAAAIARPAAAAVILASAIMCARVALLAGAINLGILPRLLPTIAAMGLVAVLAAWWVTRGKNREPARAEKSLGNPFSLKQAILFGLFYSAVLLLVRGAREWLGSAGLYPAAALSGVVDVDAVTLAMTRLGPTDTSWRVPAAAISLAVVVNTLVKAGISLGFGGRGFRAMSALGLGSMAVVGVAVAGWILLSF